MSPAFYWRADGGYQEVSEQQPQPQPAAATMCGCHLQSQAFMPRFLYPGFAPWMMPQGYMQGPIGVAGLASPPPPYDANAVAVPEPCTPPVPAVQASSKPPDASKKEEPKKKDNPWAPPKLPHGANYLFDSEHTMLHIFQKAAPIWTEKYRGQELKFKIFKVSVNFTPKMVIEQILKKSGDDCQDWAVTEVVEQGDGQWAKGTTIEHNSDKAKGTLKSMPWTSKNGGELPPVWLVVHKVDFK